MKTTAEVVTKIDLVEEILGERKEILGDDYLGYRNHVYRMINFCFAQNELQPKETKKIVIAGCFHDIGIWTASTFDYLPPSIAAAIDYLDKNNLAEWSPQIATMIGEHHKIRPVHADHLTEVFRKGDLVDFSLGMLKCGIPGEHIVDVRSTFPNAGFHCGLVRKALRWVVRHPLNPVPALKW